jgi:hypothetical protein
VLAALTLSYGPSIEDRKSVFAIAADYVLAPVFSADGLFIALAIEPKSNAHAQDLQRRIPLSHSAFESILANINSIKPLGGFEEEFGAKFVHGGRAWGNQRYRNAYLQTAELISYAPSRPIAFAYIYYMHPVTGVAKIPRDSRLDDQVRLT